MSDTTWDVLLGIATGAIALIARLGEDPPNKAETRAKLDQLGRWLLDKAAELDDQERDEQAALDARIPPDSSG